MVHGPKRQAEKVLNQMVVEAEALGTTTSAVTIDRLLEEWLRLCEARGLSPRTLHDFCISSELRQPPRIVRDSSHAEGMSGIGRPHGLSIQEFFSRFGTEDQCREALFAKR